LKQACLIECSKLAGATLFGSENQPCSAYFLCPCSPVGCSDALLHLQAQQLDSLNTSELLSMLSFGADRILSNQAGQPPSDADLERILDRSQDAAQKAAAALAAEKAAADKAADKAAAEAGGDAGAGSSAAAETAGTSAAAAAAVVKQEAAGVKQEAEQDGEAEAAAAAAAAGDNSIPNGGAVLM
jgi:hypothetical protein